MIVTVHALWKNMTQAELKAPGEADFIASHFHGFTGHLREELLEARKSTIETLFENAYFFRKDEEARYVSLPAAILRSRLPTVLTMVKKNEEARDVYDPEGIEEAAQSYIAFVEFCEAKEHDTNSALLFTISDPQETIFERVKQRPRKE